MTEHAGFPALGSHLYLPGGPCLLMNPEEIANEGAKWAGYASAIGGMIYAIWKLLKPTRERVAKWLVIPERIDGIEMSSARALAKADYLINRFHEAIYICTPDGQNILSSDALADMFGMTPDEIMGYGWTKPILQEDRAIQLNHWRNCVATHAPYIATYKIKVGGVIKRIETSATAVKSDTGKLLFYLGEVKQSDPE